MYGALEETEKKRADEEGKSKLFHFLCKKHCTPSNPRSAIEKYGCGNATNRRVGKIAEAKGIVVETGVSRSCNWLTCLKQILPSPETGEGRIIVELTLVKET